MGLFGRAQQAPTAGVPMRPFLLFAAVLLGVGALIWGYRSISTSPGTRSVTITAPEPRAPVVTLPHIDGLTQTELAVLTSGSGFDAAMKTAMLWVADRTIWTGLALLMAAIILSLATGRWWRRMLICAGGLIMLGLLAPIAVPLAQNAMDARDAVVVEHLPPTPGAR